MAEKSDSKRRRQVAQGMGKLGGADIEAFFDELSEIWSQ